MSHIKNGVSLPNNKDILAVKVQVFEFRKSDVFKAKLLGGKDARWWDGDTNLCHHMGVLSKAYNGG